MKNVRLFKSATIVGDVQGSESSDKVLTKRARFVYEGTFESMDGKVEVTADHINALAAAHNAGIAKLSGAENMADYPPLQVDHSTSGWDTVGRVVGPVEVAQDTVEGKQVLALFGNLRFLGSEAVERVKDGRWTHLSLGADLEGAKLNEMTVTPFPAAPKASLLSKYADASYKGISYTIEKEGRMFHASVVTKEGDAMGTGNVETVQEAIDGGKRLIDLLKREGRLSKGDPMDEQMAAFKKHFMESEKMSEKDADEKLSKMTDDEKKELSAALSKTPGKTEGTEESEADADKDVKDSKTAMTAAKKAFAKLTKGFKKTAEKASNAITTVQLTARLNGLRAKGKLTPAEQKEIDLVKLSALDQKAQDFFFDTYEKRLPVITPGVYGRADAESITKLAGDVQGKQMIGEMLEGMHFSRGVVKRLAGMPTSMPNSTDMAAENIGSSVGNDAGMPTSMDNMQDMSAHFAHVHKLVSAGQVEEAKAHLSKCMEMCKMKEPGAGVSQPGGEENPAHLSALAENVQTLQNQFEELVKLTTPILGTTED